jgi:CcmD family protein
MQRTTRRIAFVILLAMLSIATVAPVPAQQTPPRQQEPQSEFVPVNQLPPQDQLPAAPLLIAAYAIAWIGIFIYLASIWRRLQKVDRELADVTRRVAERSRT